MLVELLTIDTTFCNVFWQKVSEHVPFDTSTPDHDELWCEFVLGIPSRFAIFLSVCNWILPCDDSLHFLDSCWCTDRSRTGLACFRPTEIDPLLAFPASFNTPRPLPFFDTSNQRSLHIFVMVICVTYWCSLISCFTSDFQNEYCGPSAQIEDKYQPIIKDILELDSELKIEENHNTKYMVVIKKM